MIDDPPNGVEAQRVSIIIPAHNEAWAIRRLLDGLLADAAPSEFEILVICNACTDDTAKLAAAAGPDVRVIEIPEASKMLALKRGDAEARGFPRVYIDADVLISTEGIRTLVAALARPGVLATAPARDIQLDRSSLLARCYYRVWAELPQVRDGLFARNVIAVSEAGFPRIAGVPSVMSDDLAFSEAFRPDERAVVAAATVRIWPARTARDVVRRRIRISTGNTELEMSLRRSDDVKTSLSDLVTIARRRPSLVLAVPVFLGFSVAGRIGARRQVRAGDFTTWQRDESSRRAD